MNNLMIATNAALKTKQRTNVASVWTKHCNMQQQEALESCCFDEDAAQGERLSSIFESVFQRNITEIIAE